MAGGGVGHSLQGPPDSPFSSGPENSPATPFPPFLSIVFELADGSADGPLGRRSAASAASSSSHRLGVQAEADGRRAAVERFVRTWPLSEPMSFEKKLFCTNGAVTADACRSRRMDLSEERGRVSCARRHPWHAPSGTGDFDRPISARLACFERSKSVSIRWPVWWSRMFSGFRSLLQPPTCLHQPDGTN